ncbi:MAG TPA: rhodanese-like domain-containing protein [Methanocellaceae archaeon]|jgi:rhodanese-related sulfurtransferase
MALRDDIFTAMEEYTLSAPQDWNTITAQRLRQSLDAKEDLFIIDVREAGEYEGGHIHGAVNIPVNELPSRVKSLPQDRNLRIVTYCATGRRSAYAAMFLRVYGYNDVRTLAGGIREWVASGHPIEK